MADVQAYTSLVEALSSEMFSDRSDLIIAAGVDKVYSTEDAASFFPGKSGKDGKSKSDQWIYWGLRNKIFIYPDGSVIEPKQIGKGKRRRFTLPIIEEIALSCYRRGNLKEEELKEVFRRILIARYGESAFSDGSQ
jgi:hypothetical protein